MRVRLVWVERDFRGSELSRREEVLHGESAKTPTRNQVARLMARHRPELQFASRVILVDASEEGYRWHVRANKMGSNCWSYVYAEPLEDAPADESR